MENEYRFIIVEDSEEDAALNKREIKKVLGPCRFVTVETREAYQDALETFAPDAVISDYTMPRFDGLAVLRLTLDKTPFTPVIIVTGSINEETAVSCIKAGAADYILKENLKRLGPAVLTALKQKDSRVRHYQTQQALMESEKKYRALFENDPAGDFIASADGVITACNRSFAASLGYHDPREIVNRNFFQFCRRGKSCEDLMQVLAGGGPVKGFGLELVRRDGKTVHARINAYATFGPGNKISQIAGFFIDETERRRLEERLAQAQKLESLGTLAGGVAHDFNNILNIIIGYLSLVEKAAGKGEDTTRLTETIRQAAERGAALISQLLTFARKNEPRLDPVRLPAVLGDVVRLAGETFPKTIEIRVECDPGTPPVTAGGDQLHQVFLNLFVNARDAMPEGGTITVKSGKTDKCALAAKYPGTRGEYYSYACVADTGSGMVEEVRKRIFEPFFTTKGRDRGTGLGLAQVYGIIKKHNGFIDVESGPGRGSVFTVYLPARADGDRPQAARSKNPGAAGGSETVLLVEDEETLREYMTTIMRSRGYRVLDAADGDAALKLFHAHRRGIDLLLVDFGLPKMDGGELFRRVRSLDPGVRIVLMSGYVDPDAKPFLDGLGAAAFLQKPFKPDLLLETVRRVLDAGQSERPRPP